MKSKEIIIACALLFSYLFNATSQNIQFTDVASLPEARSALTSANDGENIFIVNGFGIGRPYTTEVFQYNTTQNSWSILTSATLPKRYASTEIVGNHLYVFNGEIENGMLNNRVEKINLAEGSIQFLSNHPQPSRAAGVATWNNKIYTFGGTIGQSQYSNKLYEFDPEEDAWMELSEIPFAGETKGEIIDGKLYIIGGYNGTSSNRIDVYNLATDTWEANFEMPNGISAHSTAIIGRNIYLVGDFSNLTSIAYFNTFDNSFHRSNSNLNRRRHCAAEGVGNSLFAIGGNTNSSIGSSISNVQKADFITSIKEIADIKPFEVYPNPATDILNMSKQFDELVIFNIEGKEVSRFRNTNRIELEELKRGFYILKGQLEQDLFQAKFIKS